jgi:hypothetical protein
MFIIGVLGDEMFKKFKNGTDIQSDTKDKINCRL